MKRSKIKVLYEIKKENQELKRIIRLKCAECMGWFTDPYSQCDSEECPIRNFYPTKRQYFTVIKDKRCIEGKKKAFI
jgi:hypothetical protein